MRGRGLGCVLGLCCSHTGLVLSEEGAFLRRRENARCHGHPHEDQQQQSCCGGHQAVEGRQGTRCGDSWLQDTDLPLLFRESELLKRRVLGRTVQGKDRFGRACMHPSVQQTSSETLRVVCKLPEPTQHRELRMFSMESLCLIVKTELRM